MPLVHFIFAALILYPTFSFAELPNAENRPVWTQKTCYIEGEMVYGVGVAMGVASLEDARKKSFESARWEISNFAQLQETALLVIETQMTYEEMGKDSTFSVWRLIKVPSQMIKNAREVMKENKPFYRELVSHITSLEKNREDELADDLRRAFASGVEESEFKEAFQSKKNSAIDNLYDEFGTKDEILPTGSISGITPSCIADENINLTIKAQDNHRLKNVLFSIDNSQITKKWNVNNEIFEENYSFSTKSLHLGKHGYTFKIVDASNNSFTNKGSFHIDDLQNEFRRLFLEESKE